MDEQKENLGASEIKGKKLTKMFINYQFNFTPF